MAENGCGTKGCAIVLMGMWTVGAGFLTASALLGVGPVRISPWVAAMGASWMIFGLLALALVLTGRPIAGAPKIIASALFTFPWIVLAILGVSSQARTKTGRPLASWLEVPLDTLACAIAVFLSIATVAIAVRERSSTAER